MKGFKGFDKDFKCRDMQYAENQEFSEDAEPSLCNRGLHFCEMPLDVFEFYPPDGKNVFASVEAVGITVKDDKKSATNKLMVGAALSVSEMFKAHFSLIFENITALSEITNTTGNYAHANTAGDSAHANTAGNYAIACSLGIKAKAKALKGWIVIVGWRQDDNLDWHIHGIYSSKVGGKVLGTVIEPDVFYWFENGELKHDSH